MLCIRYRQLPLFSLFYASRTGVETTWTLLAKMLYALSISVFVSACTSPPSQQQTAVLTAEQPTEVIVAAQQGDQGRLRSLLTSGSPVNVVAPVGSALDVAAHNGDTEAVIALLRAGADPNVGLRAGAPSPLHYLAERGDATGVKVLAAAGAKLDYPMANGATALALAVQNGHLSTAKALIKAGADVNVVYAGRSLLMYVVEQNSLLMAQLLVDAGVDVNYRNATGDSALSTAQRKGLQDLQMLLLQSGARS
ncbi:ankyrin repeat domain-containing protein [Hahella sp. KA22]|uniref:ankyrin repeat domain-containing protein n=1 Tax=Hahella sp. KA22 TaxID=1628392 RepID=UPI000FDF35F7|nr:ankyrin repeat domain-containing protein [Hahella sp. KA22]AZZ90113.1 ankyrin repeat domain-containing protein [Hahella sp. KA22]QAY53483.1 ankyrin repeat domain-containing protein [Hahella sp. KA22]